MSEAFGVGLVLLALACGWVLGIIETNPNKHSVIYVILMILVAIVAVFSVAVAVMFNAYFLLRAVSTGVLIALFVGSFRLTGKFLYYKRVAQIAWIINICYNLPFFFSYLTRI